jgi:hypothetical protein
MIGRVGIGHNTMDEVVRRAAFVAHVDAALVSKECSEETKCVTGGLAYPASR